MYQRSLVLHLGRAPACVLLGALFALSGCAPGGPNDITNAKVNAWVNRALAPKVKKTPQKVALRRYYIDVATLAHLHPAWLLAQTLSKRSLPTSPRQVAPKALPALPPPVQAEPFNAAREVALPPSVRTIGLDAKSAMATQSAYGEKFLASVKQRQVNEALQEDVLARQALEDEIADARRATLAQLEPKLLPDDVQLRLINLRLKLVVARLDARRDLQLIRVAPQAEQEAVKKRINTQLEEITASILEIETKWNAQLRAQEKEQEGRVAHAFDVVPRQLRAAGEARIAAQSKQRTLERSAARDDVAKTNNALLKEDFSAGSLNLSVNLPASRQIALKAMPRSSPEKFQTLPSMPSSLAEPRILARPLDKPESALKENIAKLKDRAFLDATRFAQLAALDWGGVYTTDRRAQNGTLQAVKLFFPEEKQFKGDAKTREIAQLKRR